MMEHDIITFAWGLLLGFCAGAKLMHRMWKLCDPSMVDALAKLERGSE
jgi:hypothetical protein